MDRPTALPSLIALCAALAAPALRADVSHLLSPLPVQHDGRVMPLDTLAREAVWQITGARSFQGEHPVATLARWMEDPPRAANTANILLGSRDVAGLVGAAGNHASFVQLASSIAFTDLLRRVDEARARNEPRRGLLAAAERVQQRMELLRSILERTFVRPLPAADPRAAWVAPEVRLSAVALGPRLPGWPAPEAIEREIVYNELRPERLAWIALLAAVAIAVAAWDGRSRLFQWLAFGSLLLGAAAASAALAGRWLLAGHPPAATAAGSLLWAGWGVALIALASFAARRRRLLLVNASAVAALALLLADALPLDALLHLSA